MPSQTVGRTIYAILGVWAVLAVILSVTGAAQSAPLGAIGAAVGGPVVLALLALAAWPGFRAWAFAASIRRMTVFHLWRIVPGIAFLILYEAGKLPWRFAGPAGWGDIAVAVTAPLVAYGIGTGSPGRRMAVAVWHLLGFLDLAQVVYSRVLLGLQGDTLITAMAGFPLALLPLFAVPVTLILHMLPIAILLRAKGSTP